jgi:membrane-associated protease RseP (regulator of RpoE activity)
MRTHIDRSPLAHVVCCLTVVAAVCGPLIAEEQQGTHNDQNPTAVSLPADTATTGVSFLLAATRQSDSLIGVELAPVGDVLRSHLGLGEGKGFVVMAVDDDGPAAKAGIQKNDVLVTIGNEEITALEAFRKSLGATADKPVPIGLIRAGKKQSVEVTPRSSTAAVALNWIARNLNEESKFWLGVGLAPADDTLRSQLSLAAGEGLVVTNVEGDSPAAKAGVMVNDVLLTLDGKALTTIEALSEQLQTIAEKTVSLELLRRGKPATLSVTPEKRATAWQANVLALDAAPDLDVVFLGPQQLETVTLANVLANEPLNVIYSNDLLRATQSKPDLAKQLSDLEAQVKQLEASLATLRGLLDTPAQTPPSGEQKK